MEQQPQPTQEGSIPFAVPAIDTLCATYYKVFGDLGCGRPAIVMLHGGPGGGHEYLLPFASFWPRYGFPVVFYDQIGCAGSTHLPPQTAEDPAFWTDDLFVAELDNLLDHLQLRDGAGFSVFGHSWGGRLGLAFASRSPRGLRRLVLASTSASHETMTRGYQTLRGQLSPGDQATLVAAEASGDWQAPATKAVMSILGRRHVCRTDPPPLELAPAMKRLADSPVYRTMYGPSWLAFTGSQAGFSYIPRLAQIAVPTLVYNGEHDTTQDVAVAPLFERIPHVRWITFANAGHMCHLEDGQRDKVFRTVGDFLNQEASTPSS